ncbi:two-partner secretion domain-containing protein [Pseudomonas machongensis]
MDVRLFAFLARQPSARLQPRTQFCGMPKRGLAFLLANVMFWQPLWAQAADGVVVSAPGTGLDRAGNGVPIVNIATPNASGLSHNQFSDYNVGQQGLILNNVTGRTEQTQLGGIIVGNPNLQGAAASTILNEVNGANPSQLRGYTEVAGQAARVIVANPHGITCDGCGFINTPQVTLSTGKPVIDGRGGLSGYQVEGGSVALEGAGLNADNVERFDIITRSARLNAQLRARELNIVTGRNDVDASTLAATPRAGAGGDAPALAIDSSALGGMYAGAIRLVGTEAGVGVRLAGDVAASAGDIQLDANGQLSLAQTSAAGSVKLRAAAVDLQGPVHGASQVQVTTPGALSNRQAITAGSGIGLRADGILTNLGTIEAGVNADGSRNAQGDVTIATTQLDNRGKGIVASRDLVIDAGGHLDNRGGTLSAGQDGRVAAATLDNSGQGRLLAGRNQAVRAEQLSNDQGGLVSATQVLEVSATTLHNRGGELSAGVQGTLRSATLDNQGGRLSAGQVLNVTASNVLDNRAGTLAAARDLQLQAGNVDNRNAGRIASEGQLNAQVTALDQRGSGQLHAAQALNLDLAGGHLENSEGGLITTPGQLTLQRLDSVANRAGEISAGQAYTLAARQLDNSAGKLLGGSDLRLLIATQLNNGAGLVAAQNLTLQALDLLNQDGTLQARTALQAQLGGQLDNRRGQLLAGAAAQVQADSVNNQQGRLASQGSLALTTAALDNSAQGRIGAEQGLTLDLQHGHWNNATGLLQSPGPLVLRNLATLSNRGGEISSLGSYTLSADSLDNQDGKLLSEQTLILRIAQLLDNSRAWVAANRLDVQAATLLNTDGKVQAREQLDLRAAGALDNQRGELSARTLQATAATLDNRAGRVQGDRQLTLDSQAALDNRNGALVAGEQLSLRSGDLDNTGGQLYAAGQLNLRAAQVNNGSEGRIHAGQRLDASVQGLRNAGRLFSGADLRLDLNAGLLDNQGGLINAPGQLLLEQLAHVDNRGGELSATQSFNVTAASFDNRGGKLLSEQALTLSIAQALNNAAGRIAAQGIDAQGGSMDNQQGLVQAGRGLNLAVVGPLDNRQGRVLAGGPLTLAANTLDNGAGQLVSDAGLNVRIAGELLNRAGLIGAVGALQLRSASLDNQAQGRILGQDTLTLDSDLLDNRGGRLAASAAIDLKVRQLDNRAGVVSAGQGLDFLGQRLDNSAAGLFEGKGPLRLNSQVLVNRDRGRLASAASLTLNSGELDNGAAGRISSHGALLAEVGHLDQREGGQLISDSDLTLDLRGGLLDNQRGLIHTPGQLLLRQLGEVDNRGGEISSALGFELNATRLDNDAGKLLSDQALVIRVAQLLSNAQGLIGATRVDAGAATLDNHQGTLSADEALTVQVEGALSNVAGELSSGGATELKAASLDNRDGAVLGDDSATLTISGAVDNRGGTLAARNALQIEAASLDNRAQGSLASDGRLQLRSAGLLDNQAGEIRARGLIDLALGSLDNRSGMVSGKDLLTLRSASADNQGGLLHADRHLQLFVDALDNRKGVLRGNGLLDYQGRYLDNREGLLSANGALGLDADTVDNAKGRIASRAGLDARVGTLRQQAGELVAEGSLALRGDSADNRAGGLIAGNAGMGLTVGNLDNRGGRLSSLGQVQASGTLLDNSDGGKLIAGTRLALALERLINQSGGLVYGQAVELRGARLDNQGGNLGAGQSLQVTLSDRGQPLLDAVLDNQRGRLDSAGSLTLEGVTLLNQGGQLSSKGDLRLTSATALDNRGGVIETDASLVLASASLDNRDQGRITAEGEAQVRTGTLANGQGGLLSSGQRLDLVAGAVGNQAGTIAGRQVQASVTSLDQQGGELFSVDGLVLDLNQGRLDNSAGLIRGPGSLLLRNLAQVVNRGGEISSTQAFELAAERLDNSDGKLLSSQGLTLRIARQLDNLRGLVSARSLRLEAGGLDNGAGLIGSLGDIDLRVTDALVNSGGSVLADGDLSLSAASVLNAQGQLAGKGDVLARLGSLDNHGGQVMAGGALDMQGSNVDNRGKGLLAANGKLSVSTTAFDNRDGEVSGQADVQLTGQRLDNGAGLLLAKGALAIDQQTLLNAQGLVASEAGLTLRGTRLDNSAGELRSNGALDARFDDELLNQQGRISSEASLYLKAARLDNSAGLLSSAGDLTLTSPGVLTNRGGQVLADGQLDLTASHLDNSLAGLVSAKGPLQLTTGSLDNLSGGRLTSGDSLRIDTGLLDNSGGRITSQQALLANLSGLRQHGGTLYSANRLVLDLNRGLLVNQGGLINTPGQLLLNNLGSVDNRGGEISSASAFSLAAAALDNSDGKLLGNQALGLVIDGALTNLKGRIAAANVTASAASLDNSGGLITSRGDLRLETRGQLLNQSAGLLNAGQDLDLRSASLGNRGGQVLAGRQLTLASGALDNGAQGLINSEGGLILSATELGNDGGEISAKGALTVHADSLSQQGGRLLGDSTLALLLGVAGGDLDNRSGLIRAKGALTLANLRDLDNRQGEISSALGFDLFARNLDNSAGRLISAQRLGLGAAALTNQGGLISGWQGLGVNATSLDNRNQGTLSSRDGDIDVSLVGTLDNSVGGAMASQGLLRVKAANLDNRGGYLASVGAQDLDLRGGTLDNRQGGRIDSSAGLTLKANSLDNRAGTLVGQGALALDLASQLNNAQGKLLGGSGVQVLGNATVLNQGGQLASQGTFDLTAYSLDNSDKGTLAANGALALALRDSLANDRDGLVSSQNGAITLQAARLSNQTGAVQAKDALDLNLQGALDNQRGKLIAQDGNLLLKAASVDNRGGILASLQGLLDAQVGGLLRNGQGGAAQARQLKLVALGGLDNDGGRLAAQAGTLDIRTGNLSNRGGGLYAQGQVKLDAGDLDNSAGGQLAGQAVDFTLRGTLNNNGGIVESDGRLGLSAAVFSNQGGQLRTLGSMGATQLLVSGLLDNRNGVLETANQDLTLQAGSFLNSGGRLLHGGAGELQIGMANLTSAGGDIVTLGGLTLNAASWTNSSVIQAARLTVNVGELVQTESGHLLASSSLVGRGGNWHNEGLIASNGTMDLALSGLYSSSGRATSLGRLSLDASSIDLQRAGSIAGAADVALGAANTLGAFNNLGRVSAGQTLSVSAWQLSNTGTLAGSGGLQVMAGSLSNASSGLLFAGGAMRLGADTFTNTLADVYGMGDIVVEGRAVGSRANVVKNMSGQMESLGNFSMNATQIVNERNNFGVDREVYSSSLGIRCYSCTAPPSYNVTISAPSHFVLVEKVRTSAPSSPDSVAASITSGKDLQVTGGSFTNSNSTVAASGNIRMTLDSFENQGSAVGSYTVAKYLDASVQTAQMYAYNRYNDQDYNYDFWFLNIDGEASRLKPRAFSCCGPPREHRQWVLFGTIAVDMWRGSDYYRENFEPSPLYGQGVRTDLPAAAQGAEVFAEKIIAGEAPSYLSAIVQAGGSVSITATNKIGNGVEQPWNLPAAATGRSIDTRIASTGTRVVIAPNRQLPPDLAQRQVNPLELPGFSLPTSGSGLFRLSGQGASQAAANSGTVAPGNWSLSGASIDLAQRQQPVPLVQGRSVDITDLAPTSASSRQLSEHLRQGAGLDTQAILVSVDVTGQAQQPSGVPTRGEVDPGARPEPTQISGPGNDLGLPGTTESGGSISVTRPDGGTTWVSRDDAAPIVQGAAQPTLKDVQLSTTAVVSARTSVVSPASIPRVQGVPATSRPPQPHKYLIETDPVLTDLKQFMSSDYLLGNLGYDPDASWKRLGDGFYEQRLVQQAVVARTGQRYIDGQTSDEALYRYLMDNALASKDRLGLSLGVSLSSAQVAALTHDIVWMEEHEVMGEKVLVPVLYLAHADNRLGPNGALIQGQDVNLIAGQNLENSGTLRASNNLSASAGRDLDNSGLIEAGGRLDLLAGNRIVNSAGGLISGRDVSLTSLNGDVVNERSVTTHTNAEGAYSKRTDFVDSAARIEAANDLSIHAGRDLINSGGVLSAGADLDIRTGRDLLITSAQQVDSTQIGSNYRTQTTQQYGSQVTAGGDLALSAGRDFTAIASTLEAGRNVAVDALENLTLASAANESNFYSKTKKVTRQEDHVSQVGTLVKAGGDVALTAGKDLTLISSRVSAGDEAYLYAREQLSLLAEADSDYSLYDKKSKGSFGSKKTKRDEVTDVRHVGSEVSAAGAVTLASGGDQRYQAAKLESGEDLTLVSGGAITFEGVKDLHQESHEKSKSSLAWNSAKGKGSTDETLRQSQLLAQGEVLIKAADGMQIDIKQVDRQSVSQIIDAMVVADPQLAWLKEAEARGDVDWRQVKEVHDSFKYSHSGMGVAAQMVIAIIVSYLTAGAASGLVASGATTAGASAAATTAATATTAGGAWAAGTGAALSGIGWANAAVTAGLTGLTSNAAISAINNRGNLGLVVKDTFSSDSLKGAVISGLVTGVTAGYIDPKFSGDNAGFSRTYGFDLSKLEGIGGFGLRAGAIGVTSGAIKTVVNGGSLSDNLLNALVSQASNVVAASAFNAIGNLATKNLADAESRSDAAAIALWQEGGAGRVALHALAGGAVSVASGGDFASGATAAGANAAMAGALEELYKKQPALRDTFSQLTGLAAAGLVNGDVEKGAWIAQMADRYNRQAHPKEVVQIKKQAPALAQELGISPAEAERRMAEALAYYTDNEWRQVITANGRSIDASTLAHLGQALAPMADSLDVSRANGDVPVVADAGKQYTAQQTVALLKDYASTHSAEFNDSTKNREFLRPGGDPEYAAYYANNLNFGKYDPTAETLGSVEGVGTALGDMLKGMYGLGKGLLTDTQNTASQVSHQLINSLSHPEAVVQEWQDMRAEATLYRLQGNPTAAARVEAEWQTKFVMNLVPVGKAGKLGQVSKTVAEREAIAEAVGGATGRQVPGLPSYYRDGSGVGANVVAPEGYTAVVNLRTGNFEFVAPDGKLYFYSESALVPKEGGNLAGLAAAERDIAAGKAGGGAKGADNAAYSSASGLKLSTQLAYEEAGILTRGGAGLTKEAVAASREIPISGGRLTNPAVVKELTANGSKIEDWGKFTTQSITLPSGQRSQVHYYMNKITGELNLNIDFKVKGAVK